MRKLTMIVAVATVSVLLMSMNALAGGGQQYPNGAEDIYCAACPPPGWWAVSYTFYKDLDKLTDTPGGDLDIDDGYIFAEVVRVIYSSENTIFGGRHLAHVFFQYLDIDLDLGAPGDNNSGFGNIIFDPIILTWIDGSIHYTVGVDIYIPVGEFDDDKLVNAGKDFWTFEPIFAITGIFDKLSFSAKFMYDFNTETDDQVVALGPVPKAELQPGQEFHFDYAADYVISGGLRGGVAGYYFKQVTKDEWDGADAPGKKSEALAIGPVAKYDFLLAGKPASLIAKVLFDVDTTSWAEGDSYWLKFVYSF